MKTILKFLTGRLFICGLIILVQLVALIILVLNLGQYGVYIYPLFSVMSVATIIYVVSKKDNPIFKLAWVIPIALFPLLGWLFFFLGGRGKTNKNRRKRLVELYFETKDLAPQDPAIKQAIKQQSESIASQLEYINKTSLYPIYAGTQAEYLSPGERFFERLCEELRKAERFIFMEYFIIQRGEMWDTILEIMAQKVQDGVQVRVMYDDLGCINTLPPRYYNKLKALGIEVHVFNVFGPSIDIFMNYRDHRKITVIDGNVGFTGGNNLADEYINAYVKHGHWKDSSIMLKGEAVWNLTIMFMQMWQYNRADGTDYNHYRPTTAYEDDGYVLPFGDGPLDNHLIGENAYINMISRATKYVSITTPYLVLDNEMITALCNASYSGVSVTIMTPHIADKWYVYLLSRYNYRTLIEAGVEIREYTPGFIHAKTIVVDDEIAIVGTQNFDFRSFYLHFECGALLYKNSAIKDIRNDHINIINSSVRYTLEQCKKTNWFVRLIQVCLNLFAPLM